MSTTGVKIFVRTVGQCFGCQSIIKTMESGKPVTIWESSVYPIGFVCEARIRAEAKAKSAGWPIIPDASPKLR